MLTPPLLVLERIPLTLFFFAGGEKSAADGADPTEQSRIAPLVEDSERIRSASTMARIDDFE
jgi:hypothetical protein